MSQYIAEIFHIHMYVDFVTWSIWWFGISSVGWQCVRYGQCLFVTYFVTYFAQ